MTQNELLAWNKLTDKNKRNIFEEISKNMGLPAIAAEKDWWVVRTLEIIFQTEIAQHTVFKGGTSLSKAWKLIDRFSEDVDLALDRAFLGFDKPDDQMSGAQVSKLRKHSFRYISQVYLPLIRKQFADTGLTNVVLELSEVTSSDEDPVKIFVLYPSVTESSTYLSPRIEIEIGSRSLIEPYTEREITSFVGEQFIGRDFADTAIKIPVVNPERTFLEKIFLLHEEFQLPTLKMRLDRKSRHLYDLEKLMDTEFAQKALNDKDLYDHIVHHRRNMTPLRGIDYSNHAPKKINPLPPTEMLGEWKKDYEQMQQSMIYKESPSFDKLISRISELKDRVNQMP